MLPVLRRLWGLAAWAAVLVSLSAAADPPARVGRLSLAEGAVTFRIQGQDGSSAAASNWPVSSGAILDTGRDGRAEVQVGSSVFRLAGDSSVEFTVVDDGRIALQLGRGTLALTVRERDQADAIEIAIPGGQVQVGAPGRYRIDIDSAAGNVQVSSWEGSAYLYRPGGELGIPGARRGVAYGSGGWFLADLPREDGFDRWADARDAAGNAPLARRYVSPEMTGYEDLDRYGDWGSDADYGAVWYPRAVAADWAPYRQGRWAWVPPWGWTWVDQAPWGFAPFHYGRWLFMGGRWAWVPGTYVRRPVYAPALVGWIGGPAWSAGFGFGTAPAVGWFPLAPREIFIPAYQSSPAYVRQANINHVKDPAAIHRALADPHAHPAFTHRASPQAVTVVPAEVVRRGGAITPAQVQHREPRELTRAPLAVQAPAAVGPSPAEAAPRPWRDGGPGPVHHPVQVSPSPAASAPLPVPGAAATTTGRDGNADFRRSGAFRPGRLEASPSPAIPIPGGRESLPRRIEAEGRYEQRPEAVRPLPRVWEARPAVPVHGPMEPRPAPPRDGRGSSHDHGKPPNAR